LNGEPIAFAGKTLASFENVVRDTVGKLIFSRSNLVGPRDPEVREDRYTIRLIFEKTGGLKPFVLPGLEDEQARRVELDHNGIIYYSSIQTAQNVSDTFKYEDGRIAGTWVFKAPAGGPTGALSEIALTADVEVPEELR
jgi:hypothetical protein